MEVTVDEHVAFFEHGIFVVTVGKDERPAVYGQDGEGGGDGKFEDHGIDVGVAVAAHAEDVRFHGIEDGGGFERGVLFGQGVAGAVVEKIAEQDEFLRFFLLPALF